MAKVVIYTKDNCAYCTAAKTLLGEKGAPYSEVNLQTKPDELAALKAKTGLRTVPQIFIGEKLVGGFSELQKLEQQGELDALLGRS
jgi:glutaredoxin 3